MAALITRINTPWLLVSGIAGFSCSVDYFDRLTFSSFSHHDNSISLHFFTFTDKESSLTFSNLVIYLQLHYLGSLSDWMGS